MLGSNFLFLDNNFKILKPSQYSIVFNNGQPKQIKCHKIYRNLLNSERTVSRFDSVHLVSQYSVNQNQNLTSKFSIRY